MDVTIRLLKDEHRLYQPFYDLVIFLQAIHFQTLSMYAPGADPQAGGILFPATQFPKAIGIPAGGALAFALTNNCTFLEVKLTPITGILKSVFPATGQNAPQMARLYANAISPIFLVFYETYQPWWVAKFNRDEKTWPPLLRFARIIRNAVGHRSRIDWRSPNVAPVSWGELVYSHADDGRSIFEKDLALADVLLLMFDLSDELDRLGCPLDPS